MSRNGFQVNRFIVSLCLAAAAAVGVYGQATPAPKTPKKPATRVEAPLPTEPPEMPEREMPARGISEKAIAVDGNVNIKLPCIAQAKVTINGWERNEIRVFVKNGSKIAFRVHEKDPTSGKPVWVLITNMVSDRPGPPVSDCLYGERIEIDVPIKASLSISGREANTKVDSVRKIYIQNVDGDVALRNISGGITASTYQGNVVVENSGGQISLETTTGNIVAYEVSSGQIGDTFKAKTNSGAITLQKVDHRQIDSNSVSGSVSFNGKFLSGGLYNFKTSKGSIKLAIPADSSCKIIAWYGFGTFRPASPFPFKILTQNVSEGGKSLVGIMGAGDATVNLTTSSGSITVGKQQ